MKIKPIAEAILRESSLSRVWQHIQNGKSFAVISAYRGNYTESDNLKRHNQLKDDIRSLGLGYVEQKSGYTYADPQSGEEGSVEERSLFIPEIAKNDAIRIASKYEQESILWKDDTEFVLYYVVSGKTDAFNKGTGTDITFDPATLKFAYSQFIKSKNKNAIKKFAFVMKEFRVPSKEDAYRAMKKKEKLLAEWVDVL